MKITLQTGPQVNLVRSFVPGELRVGDAVIHSSCLLTADSMDTEWPPQALSELTLAHLDHVIAQQPEIVLIGSGAKQRFPERSIMMALLSRRIGVEVMDTAAACRTFNILVAEDRRVVAALFLKE
ncbi:MAG: Mth938-like domain-containing protein [Steroidobacteraceae bacterium]